MSQADIIKGIEEEIIKGNPLDLNNAIMLMETDYPDLFELFASANRIRRYFKGDTVRLCSIINAKSGRCDQDCAFCAQSSYHSSNIATYPLLTADKILEGAQVAYNRNVEKYGVVTSGKRLKQTELEGVCHTISALKDKIKIHRCASLGLLSVEEASQLKEAGLEEYHHNLETSANFYPIICTTRKYEDNVATILNAKKAGLRICSGGIFGIGEKPIHRLELFFTLKELDVDTIPLNFLNPIPGTRLESSPQLLPMEILKIISLARFILPDKDIKVAGGREKNLRDMQSFIFFAGANSIMVGGYLTTQGRSYEEDLRMIADLGLNIQSIH